MEVGQPGELYIGGVCVAAEHWNRKELSAEKFVESPRDDDQTYYRTGDLVRLKTDGNYEFLGRIDDLINRYRRTRISISDYSSSNSIGLLYDSRLSYYGSRLKSQASQCFSFKVNRYDVSGRLSTAGLY